MHLPESIETQRLIVSVAKRGDGGKLNKAVIGSLASLKPWLGWVTPPPTLEQSEEACRRAYARFLLNEDWMALLFHKDNHDVVGGVGLHNIDWSKRQFEIGYWGNLCYSKQGLITEAVTALVGYAFKELKAQRVFLTTDENNTASCKVAERAGFIHEQTLINDRYTPLGALRNTKVYSITAFNLPADTL